MGEGRPPLGRGPGSLLSSASSVWRKGQEEKGGTLQITLVFFYHCWICCCMFSNTVCVCIYIVVLVKLSIFYLASVKIDYSVYWRPQPVVECGPFVILL